MDEPPISLVGSLLISAFLLPPLILASRTVIGIVQWFNRRDDPRCANRPPGFPAFLPPAHNPAMNESESESSVRTTARSILYMLLVLAPIVALEPGYLIPLCVGVIANLGLMVIAAAVIGSPITGAYFILAVVRGLNHRDDPRHGNRGMENQHRRIIRGLAVGAAVMLCCFIVANACIVLSLGGQFRLIAWPWYEEWWQAIMCIPAGAAAFWWAYSRSRVPQVPNPNGPCES